MTVSNDAQQFIGRTAMDTEGSKVGKIEQVYLDDTTNEPVWVTVSTGLFGAAPPVRGRRAPRLPRTVS
jgi:uncharacterized protein YrrD